MPRASAVLVALPHALIAARVSDPASYVLPRLEDGRADHSAYCCRGPIACQQVHILWVPPPVGRPLHVQEDVKLCPQYLIVMLLTMT